MGRGVGWRQAVGLHARFTIVLVGVAALLALIGRAPTSRLGGSSGVDAMWMALALDVIASSLAGLPVTLARVHPRKEQVIAVTLGSLALRMALVVLLALAVVLAGEVHEKAFLLWVAIGYLALLPVDTLHALRHTQSFRDPRHVER